MVGGSITNTSIFEEMKKTGTKKKKDRAYVKISYVLLQT